MPLHLHAGSVAMASFDPMALEAERALIIVAMVLGGPALVTRGAQLAAVTAEGILCLAFACPHLARGASRSCSMPESADLQLQSMSIFASAL